MPERFLIVDDDPDSTFLARRNLLASFPEAIVDQAESGQAALELIGQHEFTAVITDYRMPWMDGLTLVRKIRAQHIGVPIVLRTAMENLETQAHEAGVDLVLPWFRWRDLGAMVKELVHCHATGKDCHS